MSGMVYETHNTIDGQQVGGVVAEPSSLTTVHK